MQKTTYLLIVLIVITLSISLIRRDAFSVDTPADAQQVGNQKDGKPDRYQEAKRHFPTVDYDEPNLPDTEENRARKEKKKRFNDLGNWVSKFTQPYIRENRSSAVNLDFPALPVAKSDIILIGVVAETKAHLSENKRNVFSELAVDVETVFKTSNKQVRPGSIISVDRMGGVVKYPNGQLVLYRRAGMHIPKFGGRYLFFLNLLNKHDYGILTAYELTETGVVALDMSPQFFALEGKSETEVLSELRGLLQNSSN